MGSGWAWLVFNNRTKSLEYRYTEIHDVVGDLDRNLIPLLCLDMWEHAFYVDYENRKDEYINRMWLIVNWSMVE